MREMEYSAYIEKHVKYFVFHEIVLIFILVCKASHRVHIDIRTKSE